jgi:4-hydroxythreonine-4-phosphate dehydrogenase
MKPIALTVGMGIGPEISIKALASFTHPTLLLSRKGLLLEALKQLGLDWNHLWNFPTVQVIEFEDAEEPAEVQAIRTATELCLSRQASAVVTGPINKSSLMEQGFEFAGHTGFLGHLCDVSNPVMAFSGGRYQVVLVTTHIPLSNVAESLTTEKIVHTVQTAHEAWLERGEAVRFAICGLNPHAGEFGKLGHEDLEIIQPACDILRQKGVSVTDVVSSETAFLMARDGVVDVVVAMYHDQGLTPLKLVDFGHSVNWTLGLPIVRTSVDHGTADGISGKGCANPSSLIAAWKLAFQIANQRPEILSTQALKSSQGTLVKEPFAKDSMSVRP